MKKYLLAAALLMGTVAIPAHASDDKKVLSDASKISAAAGVIATATYVFGATTAAPLIGAVGLTAGIMYGITKAEKESYLETVIYNAGSTAIAGVLTTVSFMIVNELI